MRNKMYFGEHNNMEFRVIISSLPDIPIAEEDGEWVQVAGEDGERFVSNNALRSVTFSVPIWIPPTANVNAVTSWLSGAGNVRFNEWGWFWKARIEGEIHLAPCPFNDGWIAAPTFKAKPHRYVWPEAAPIALKESSVQMPGSGTARAKPLIEVVGSGDITVMVDGSTVMINDLAGSISLDCEAKIAYSGQLLMTDKISIVDGVWPTLSPEITKISWVGDVDSVIITPRWRYR